MTDKRLGQINEELLELIDALEEVGEDVPELSKQINLVIDLMSQASEKLDELEESV